MSLLDKIKGEFIDIVEHLEDGGDTLVWRFPRYQNEIKNGARLVVREGQIAVLVNEGQLADTFHPGTYSLTTQNLPILSTLKGWKFGFDSPFKAEVYFVSSRRFTDQKWGTRNPVMTRDAQLGMVRLRAYGSYVLQVTDVHKLMSQIVGTQAQFDVDDITEQVRNLVVSRFADMIGDAKIPVLDLAPHYDELGQLLEKKIQTEIAEYGLKCFQLLVENISVPEEVERSMDKRASMTAVGESDYSRYQMATAAEVAAGNPGGMAAGGMGLGMGFGMAQQMGNGVAPPPPLPGNGSDAIWWIALEGVKNGPHTLAALSLLQASGKLKPESLVWKSGMAHWSPAREVMELRPVFPAEPPPLPKG